VLVLPFEFSTREPDRFVDDILEFGGHDPSTFGYDCGVTSD
jgi:hypothetical protein